MPPKPYRPCNHPGCHALSINSHCDKHKPEQRGSWKKNKNSGRRLTGRALQRERALLFRNYPICVICGSGPSKYRDHIVSLAEGGPDIRENTQALCKKCHDGKTGMEAARGRKRGRND